MEPRYHLRFTGRLQDGLSHEEVAANLVKLTSLSPEKATALLSPGKPLVLKKNIDLDTAKKYRTTFEKAGMIIQIVKAAATTPAEHGTPQTEPPPSAVNKTAPGPAAGTPPPLQRPIPENPYASPKADLKVKKATKGGWHDQPRKVPASHGWDWLISATSMFFEQPWIWMGMWLVFFLLIFCLNLIPFIGQLCAGLLGVVLSGGLMLAAQAQTDGEEVKVSHVFSGFTHNTNQLLLVGLFYILFFVFFGLIMGGIMGFSLLSAFHSGNPAAAAAALRTNLPLILGVSLFSMLLAVPLMMAYWFAPALAALADQRAMNAYRLSFKGCMKNWAAFLVYGLAILVVGIIFMIIFSAVSGILAYLILHRGSFLLAFLPMLIIVLLGIPTAAVISLTIFTGCRDIYYQTA